MSEGQHTPGPWSFKRAKFAVDGEFDFGVSALFDGKPLCIAEAFARAASDVRPDAYANARLIAAAPEMLVALQLYNATYASTQSHPTAAQEAACINAVRAAIAQATGESP